MFSKATKNEMDNFLSSFNKKMSFLLHGTIGHLPINFYHFNVEYIYGSCENSFFKQDERGKRTVLVCNDGKMPARIMLSTFSECWEIVFPWKCEFETSPFTGNFVIESLTLFLLLGLLCFKNLRV